METVLAEAQDFGRHASVAAVERHLGIAHPTFYRNYPELIEWFKTQSSGLRQARTARGTVARTDEAEALRRLRRENEDLRRTVKIYAEKIRQLSLENEGLRAVANARSGVADLQDRRRRRDEPR
jgi:hypothetical protein